MKALINPLLNNLVAQVEPNGSEFEVAQPFYWVNCDDTIIAGQFVYDNNEFLPYAPPPNPPPSVEDNKQMAIQLLQQTDWTSIGDVGNPQTANPYLANQAAFIAWRSKIRAIAVNPIAGNIDIFFEIPQEIWITV